jgi:alpha-1,3-rhamnosyl/mannosyltransferase
MHIGIDGLPLTEILTGIGHYTNELARHLASENSTDTIGVVSPRPFIRTLHIDGNRSANLSFIRTRTSPWNLRWWSLGLPRHLRRRSIDVFHGTNFEVPLQKVCPTVITIHDLSMLLHAETHEKKLVRRAQSRIPVMARAATMVITPSEAVRREVHEHLEIPLERVVAVSESARDCFQPMKEEATRAVRRKLGINEDFLLYVGTVEPRKNLRILLSAFEDCVGSHSRPLQLVLAGRKGWLVDDLLKSFQRSPVAASIILTGYLSDQELAALYSSCTAFIYPSVYEGFGLPPLEAMACGAPVIVSRIPSLVEVTGGACRAFDSSNSKELTAVILELLDSEVQRRELSRAGLDHAARFSWSRCARETRAVYEEAIERFSN